MAMTLSEAKKKLPKFAVGLADEVVTSSDLFQAVREELKAYRRGENPLTTEQASALYDFLKEEQ